MKKITALFLVVFLAFSALNTSVVCGADTISVTYNGKAISFDQPPVIIDGRTLVPLRAIFETLGAEVDWDADTKQITAIKGDTAVLMTINSKIMTAGTIGGTAKDKTLDAAPTIINGRTMVPARAVAEAFDCHVSWDNNTKTVRIIDFNSSSSVSGEENNVEESSPKAYTENNSGKVLSNYTTDMNSTSYNTQEAYSHACCAYIYNGVVYYSFVYQPTIYAYDGSSTKEYNAGGAPSGIVVTGNKIYYINETDNKVCSIDLSSGAIEILFAKLPTLRSFKIYNNVMYICGFEGTDEQFYALNLNDGSSSLICSYETKNGGLFLGIGNDKIYFSAIGDEVTICSVGLNGGRVSEIFTPEGTSNEYLEGKENIYIKANSFKGRSSSGERMYDSTYYIVYTANGSYREVSEDEYNSNYVSDIRADGVNDGYEYAGKNSSITKTNKSTGATETLVAAGSSEKYNYLANDENMVVYWSGNVNSKRVAKADQYGPAMYGCLSHNTLGYNSANMYVVNTNGSNIRLINSYGSQTGSSPTSSSSSGFDSGASAPSSQTCVICHGSGSVTCTYCHGSGIAISASIGLGGHVSEGICPSCGGSGRKTCSVCNGTGVTYN